MLEEITLNHAEGKTIKSVHSSETDRGQFLIVFTDETFTCLGQYRQNGIGPARIVGDQFELHDFGYSDLVRAGIISGEELQEIKEEQTRTDQHQRDSQERSTYERLKQKFEP